MAFHDIKINNKKKKKISLPVPSFLPATAGSTGFWRPKYCCGIILPPNC